MSEKPEGSRKLSLSQRLLIAPLVSLILFALLTAAFIYESSRQNALLKQIADHDFASYDHYVKIFSNFSNHHVALHKIFQNTENVDPKKLQDLAKQHLNDIHQTIEEFKKNIPPVNAQSKIGQLRTEFLDATRAYIETASVAVTSIEANPLSANTQILLINSRFTATAQTLDKLLDSGRQTIRTEIVNGIKVGKGNLIAIATAATISALFLLALSIILSHFLSRSLARQVTLLTELGAQTGINFSIHGRDEIERIGNATKLFRQFLLELHDKDRALAQINETLSVTLEELWQARDELELRVQERTQELQAANDGLRSEIELRKVAERRLSIYGEVIRSTGEAVAITDLKGTIIEVNPAYEKSIAKAREVLIGKKLYQNDLNDFSQAGHNIWELVEKDGHWSGEILDRKSNGELFQSWVLVNAVLDEQGNTLHYVCVSRDITALKESEQQLKKLAFYDALTGMPNRALFKDRLAVALTEAQRQQTLVSVIYLDLDRFKFINDSAGHAFGDTLLQAIAERIKETVRDCDTVARLGGDEFVIMITDLNRPQDAGTVAQKVLEAFSRSIEINGQVLYLTASLGISLFPDDGDRAEALLKNADAAMYHAKAQGGNNFQFYTRQLSEEAHARVTLESALRQAIKQQEFQLHYQPKVDLKTGKISGAEALIRWRHPDLGMIPPDRFIPLAEETGLIVSIGEWVLRTACAQAKVWHTAGYSNLSIAVNLSARQVQQRDILDAVRNILRETEFNPDRLELELTESLLMKDSETVLETLSQLHNMGVVLSIDDFGTGYSSLSYLKRFPITVVKIDRSFTRDVIDCSDDASLTKAILAMARSLNMKTVAEGVETQGQLEFFSLYECDAIQGYYFSKPLPAEDMTALLHEGKNLSVKGQ